MSNSSFMELPNLLQKSKLADSVYPATCAFLCVPDAAMCPKTHRHRFLSPAAWRPRLAQRRGNKSTQMLMAGFLGGSVAKRLPADAGDMGLIPGLGRPPMLWSN